MPSTQTTLGVAFVCWAASCSPLPPPPPSAAPSAVASTAEPVFVEPMGPQTAEEWLALAEQADKLGALDVANACRGQAYTIRPEPQILEAWLTGLLASGEHSLARSVWAERRTSVGGEVAARLEALFAKLPAPSKPGSLSPPEATKELRAAYEAELSGRSADAGAAFALATDAAPHPYHLVHAARLWAKNGDHLRAQRALSTARIALREAGATAELLTVHKWYTRQSLWLDQRPLLVRYLNSIDEPGQVMSETQIWPPGPATEPLMRFYSRLSPEVTVVSEGGQDLVQCERGTIFVRDALTGAVRRSFDTGLERISVLRAAGSGPGMTLLAAAGPVITLWNGEGKDLGKLEIEGKTPTITRVYRTDAVEHDNILRDASSWVVSAALSADHRLVAAGGSDSKVRIFDRKTGAKKVLEYAWAYQERRHMGGNPDLNEPLTMAFSPQADKLLVAYSHGPLITWSPQTGTKLSFVDGKCAVSEATAYVNRFTPKTEPHRAPTAEEQQGCGRSKTAQLSPDLSTIATSMWGVRIRSAASGSPQAFFLEEGLPNDQLAFSSAGSLLMADLYGTMASWSPEDTAPRKLVEHGPTGPIDPHLARSGRWLSFNLDRRDIVLDLAKKKRVQLPIPDARLYALSSDGAVAALKTKEAIELREMGSGNLLVRYPVPAGEDAKVWLARGGKTALMRVSRYPKTYLVLCAAEKSGCDVLSFGADSDLVAITEDGRTVAAQDGNKALQIYDVATRKVLLDAGQDVRNVALSRDGGAVAWVTQPDRHKRHVIVRYQRLDKKGDAQLHEISAEGWPQDLALSADGEDVWVLLEGSLVRWRPAAGTQVEHKETAIVLAHRIHISEDGKTLFLEGYNRVVLRETGKDLRPLLTLYPLLSGGYLARSAAGAIDGTDDAKDHVITRVTREGETLVFDGQLGWEAARVDGLLPRALRGENVKPLIAFGSPKDVTSL